MKRNLKIKGFSLLSILFPLFAHAQGESQPVTIDNLPVYKIPPLLTSVTLIKPQAQEICHA
jgi:hypothetical protein